MCMVHGCRTMMCCTHRPHGQRCVAVPCNMHAVRLHSKKGKVTSGKSGLSHVSSLRPQASTSSPGHSRGRFVQAPPAMCPATFSCQAQAQQGSRQQRNNPSSNKTYLTGSHRAMPCSPRRQQTPQTRHRAAGLNLRAGAASRAAPRSRPPCGLACPPHMHAAPFSMWPGLACPPHMHAATTGARHLASYSS